MAKEYSYPSTRKTTLGARLRIAILPFGIRTPTAYTITLVANFNSNNKSNYIYIISNQDVWISPETELIFNGVSIIVAEEVLIEQSLTTVSILDQPPDIFIPINTTTSYNGLILVHGCRSCSINPEIQTTDTTNVSHGIEKEEKQTFNSRKISIDVLEIYGDVGGYLLLEMCDNNIYRNFEFWFNYSYPDSSFEEGAILITSVAKTQNKQSLKNYQITGRIQPKTYNYQNVL